MWIHNTVSLCAHSEWWLEGVAEGVWSGYLVLASLPSTLPHLLLRWWFCSLGATAEMLRLEGSMWVICWSTVRPLEKIDLQRSKIALKYLSENKSPSARYNLVLIAYLIYSVVCRHRLQVLSKVTVLLRWIYRLQFPFGLCERVVRLCPTSEHAQRLLTSPWSGQ